MKTFLNECIAKILKDNKDLSKITVILPTQRLCSIFISLLNKEINSPQFSPNIYSIKDFVSNLSDLSKASKAEEYLYLYKVYMEVFKNNPNMKHVYWENFIKKGHTELIMKLSNRDFYNLFKFVKK